jgi:hypothetical protein
MGVSLKLLGVLSLISVTLFTVLPSPALAANLSRPEAESDMAKAIGHRFGEGFELTALEYPQALRCKYRTPYRSKCAFGMALGDSAITGKGTVWLSYCGQGTSGYCWTTYLRATYIDEYCLYVEREGWDRCTKVVRQKW